MSNGTPNPGEGALYNWFLQVKGRIQATFGAMLEHEVTLTPDSPKRLQSADYETLLSEGALSISFPYGPAGSWHALLPLPLAGALADLAAMGDGSAVYQDEIHSSTIKELWGQVAADLEADIVQVAGDSSELGDISLNATADTVIAGYGSAPAIICRMDVDGWGSSPIVLLFEEKLVSAFGGSPSEEPAPAPRQATPAPKAPPPLPPPQAAPPPPRRDQPIARPVSFDDFGPEPMRALNEKPRNIDSLLDISLPITIELGRTKMLVRDVLDLGPGSVIELDKVSGEPVDLYVNDKRFARGEVVIIEENFGVRITELLKVDERLKALR